MRWKWRWKRWNKKNRPICKQDERGVYGKMAKKETAKKEIVKKDELREEKMKALENALTQLNKT